ncbi:50S ribosomal protein L32 [Buchnera aphidicola]|uniref:50S ribosomal protein L32 n=1 Tax=Buchnera aphidicola TaxID=9 RepID=UPI0030EBFB57
MAVQKSKPTRSKRGMRRSHDSIKNSTLISFEKLSKEYHVRHHITKKGFYRGKKYLFLKKNDKN